MDFRVGKFGFQGFDSVHALGFGIIVTCATEQPVRLRDRGVDYLVRSPVETLPASLDLDQVIPLPTVEQILAFSTTPTKPIPLSIVILDGILATQFTSPTGARIISVSDLLYRLKHDPEVVEKALKKARLACQQIEKFTLARSSDWLRDAIGDYAPESIQMPLLGPTKKDGLSVIMTIDPAFMYSARRTLSDGLIGAACNYSVHYPRYTSLFARIGAARFLHAQSVAGSMVNFYMPLIQGEIELTPETHWKIFPGVSIPSKQAVLVTMFNLLRDETSSNFQTDQFTYQVLQLQQKGKQSISAERGMCSTDWVKPFQQHVGLGLLERWRVLLRLDQNEIDIDLNKLMEFIEWPSAATWFDHLEDASNYWRFNSSPRVKPYSVEEVRKISSMSNSTALSDIFSREKGTLRFGRALRLLGNYNRSALRNITSELRSVSTIEDLCLVLDLANQRFVTAFSKTDFIIIPDDQDSEQLMRDVEVHGVPIIARLLILLSSLRFDRVNDNAKDEPNKTSSKRGGVTYYDEENPVADRICIQTEDSVPGTLFE